MKNECHPIMVFLSEISFWILAALIVFYLYAIIVARTQFPVFVFGLLITLGIIAFCLIIKGIIHDNLAKNSNETNS